MSLRFGSQTWSLEVPDSWRALDDEECATLITEDDVGAFQISAYFKDSTVTDEDLEDFAAEHLDAGARPSATQEGDFVGFEIAFGEEGRFWRCWYLRYAKKMLFITYDCDIESRGVDDESIQAALCTLSSVNPESA